MTWHLDIVAGLAQHMLANRFYLFSIMKIIKTKHRSRLSGIHLMHLILLSASKVNPKRDAIIKNIQI